MAELTASAVRASAEACAAAWGAARLAAATRDVADDAPRFDVVFARWPVLASTDALDVALDVRDAVVPAATGRDPGARNAAPPDPATSAGSALATWVVAARVRAVVAPYAARLADWRRRATVRVPGGPSVPWAEVSERLAGLAGDAVTRRALGAARAALAAQELAPIARERVARTCAADGRAARARVAGGGHGRRVRGRG